MRTVLSGRCELLLWSSFLCCLPILPGCNLLTEPDPAVNTTAYTPRWGITLKDHRTGMVLSQDHPVPGTDLVIDIVPDTSAMHVEVLGVSINGIGLAHMDDSWYDSWVRVGCILTIRTNTISVLTPSYIAPTHGQSLMTVTMRATNPRAGLYAMQARQVVITIAFDFP